jgi:hypothetical protein
VSAAPDVAAEVAAILKEAAKTPPPPAVLRIALDDRAVIVTTDAFAGGIEHWRIESADDPRLAELRELDRMAALIGLALVYARRAAA